MTPHDWQQMKPQERESYVWSVLGITERELAKTVAEWEYEWGKKPNAIYISFQPLNELRQTAGIVLRKLLKRTLTVIPMDADPGQFILSLEDPWAWGDLFYL